MTEPAARPKRYYLLWFVAAALALGAVLVELVKVGTFAWTPAIGGGICLLMGLVSMRRESSGPSATRAPDARKPDE